MSLQPSFVLYGHSSRIRTFAEIGSEDKIISASWDGTVKLWAPSEKKCIRTFPHNSLVFDVSIVDDTTVLTVSGFDAQLLRITDGCVLAQSKRCRNNLLSCSALSATTAVLGDEKGNLLKIEWRKEDTNINIVRQISMAHKAGINRIFVCGDKFATCSHDNITRLWDSNSLSLLQTFQGHTKQVKCVALNENYLVSGSWDKTVRIYDIRSSSPIASVTTHNRSVHFVHIAQGSNIVISGCHDGVVALHMLPTGDFISKYNVGERIVGGTLLRSGLLAVTYERPYVINVFEIEQIRSSLAIHQTQSTLEQALTSVLSNPTILTLQFIVNAIRADNVLAASDLYCGHNIVLLAIRCGVITATEVRKFNDDLWFFEENLYYPASKLIHESGDMLYPVFHHAQFVGIIRDGHRFRCEHENRVDSSIQFESMRSSLDKLHARLTKIDQHVISISDAVQTNAKNFRFLFEAIKKKEKMMRYAGFAKVLLSLVPLLGKSFGDAAYAGADVLFSLSAEDIVETGIELGKAGVGEVANVDLSNAQVTYCVLSSRRMDMMSEEARTIIASAVRQSGFKSMHVLRATLKDVIQDGALENNLVATLDMGSSEWLNNDAAVMETESSEKYQESAVRLQFNVFALGRRKKTLSIAESTSALDIVLNVLEIPKKISTSEFETEFIRISEELEVSEDAFVDVFSAVKKNFRAFDKGYLSGLYAKKFHKTNADRATTGIEFAARTLQHVSKELNARGAYGDNSVSEVIITPEMIAQYDEDGDGKVDQHEFVTAALSILHGIERS